MKPSHCVLALLTLLTAARPGIADAQRLVVHVTHQRNALTTGTKVSFGNKNDETVTSRSFGPYTLKKGTQVCVAVDNGYSLFYDYSISTSVDSTKESVPNLASFAALLNTLLPAPPGAAPGGQKHGETVAMALKDWLGDFSKLIVPFAKSIDAAQAAIRESDDPDKGFPWALAAAKAIPESPTTSDLKEWQKGATPTDPNDASGRVLVAALAAYAFTLDSVRASLKKTYTDTTPSFNMPCDSVRAGKTTFTLKIHPKKDYATRDHGDALATIVVNQEYERSRVETFPIGLFGFTDKVSRFKLDEAGIVRDEPEFQANGHPGAALVINVRAGEIAWGPGIAVGVDANKKLSMSDFLGTLIVSWRDAVRIGGGLGKSDVATGLSSGAVGKTLPAGTKIDDVVSKGPRFTWYLLVGLPGLTLRNPF